MDAEWQGDDLAAWQPADAAGFPRKQQSGNHDGCSILLSNYDNYAFLNSCAAEHPL